MQEKLIGLRKGKLLTQKNMANALDIDLRTYQAKERGETQFKLNEMFEISKIIGKPMDEIFLPTNFIKHEVIKEKEESK